MCGVVADEPGPLGTRAGDLSAWDKLQLGWLDYETVLPGMTRSLEIGPHEYNSAKPQAILTVLPEKEVTTELGAPFAGEVPSASVRFAGECASRVPRPVSQD